MLNWNFKDWIIISTPPERVNAFFTAFMQAILAPLESQYVIFKDYCMIYLDQIKVNGQTIVLQEFLNRNFDNTLKRIEIITLGDETALLMFADDILKQPIIMGTQIFTSQTVYDNLFDFEVVVPNAVLTPLQVLQLKKLTNTYRIAGTRAKFRQQNGTII